MRARAVDQLIAEMAATPDLPRSYEGSPTQKCTEGDSRLEKLHTRNSLSLARLLLLQSAFKACPHMRFRGRLPQHLTANH
jgi:hypothetical protein